MALVNDDCLIPTKDAPELGYIKESSNEQYVPDVFYKVSLKIYLEAVKLRMNSHFYEEYCEKILK